MAVDLSAWAEELERDNLEPDFTGALNIDGDGKPVVRILFAFDPEMPESARNGIIVGLAQVMAEAL